MQINTMKMFRLTYLLLSVTEYMRRKPSPDRMYCSRMALKASCPAVSSTKNRICMNLRHGCCDLPTSICNRVDKEEAFTRPHILLTHCTKLLLTRRVQN